MPSLVMTLLGPDRPGLVNSVSDVVREQGGNWLESRMSHLAGQFAGIVRVDAPEAKLDALASALRGIDGLQVIVESDVTGTGAEGGQTVQLSLMGNDQPGIVVAVSQVLRSQNVNVEEMSTECKAAPMSGGSIFTANAQLRLPDGLTLQALQERLEGIAADLMVEIGLKE